MNLMADVGSLWGKVNNSLFLEFLINGPNTEKCSGFFFHVL